MKSPYKVLELDLLYFTTREKYEEGTTPYSLIHNAYLKYSNKMLLADTDLKVDRILLKAKDRLVGLEAIIDGMKVEGLL